MQNSRLIAMRQAPWITSGLVSLLVGVITIGLVSCEPEGAKPVARLAAVVNGTDEPLMTFAYKACDVVTIRYLRPLAVDAAPAQYPDPLLDNGVRRESIDASYVGGQLTSLMINDFMRNNVRRSRTYLAVYVDGQLAELTLSEEEPQRVGTPQNRDLRFFYDDLNRVDSIIYGTSFSAVFTYNDVGNITYAKYRDPELAKSTEEFYGYAGATGANPLAISPLQLLQPYAAYWSAQPVVRATFGLREYSHKFVEGRVTESSDLTFGDSSVVQKYEYDTKICPQ